MKTRKSKWRCVRRRRGIVLLAAALLLLWGNPIVSRAEAKGVVIPNSVSIRKAPEQGSEVIGSSTAGKEIDIRGQIESGGILWYQVYINADTMGYVRADMIEKKGDGTIPTVSVTAQGSESQSSDAGADGGEQTSAPTISEGGAQVEAQEAMDLQYAATNVQAKVRPDPSTSNPHLDSLTPGTQVVVSGKSVGSDSKTWYYVTYTGGNGSERTGYIRSDLLDLGEMLPVEAPVEETPAQTPEEPEQPVRNDYELKIETDAEGVATWYLYDNIKGEKQALLPLLESTPSQSVDDEKGTGAIVKQRIVIVVLSVLLAALAVAVVVLAFKLRDTYYEDDDEEEEADTRRSAKRESAERDERRAARRVNDGKEQDGRRTTGSEERTARRRTAASEGEPRRREGQSRENDRQEGRRREREVSYEEDASTEAVRPASRRKAKNFLLDDDEFEFEFLNMDDKDLK